MPKDRLAAFSDGVIAVIITIMVLELKVPHSADWAALKGLMPIILSYVLSFLNVAIYWNNHHHLLHSAERVSGGMLWANMHLLFWLSLMPFTTDWMDENHFDSIPVAVYGFVLLMSGLSYTILQWTIVRVEGPRSLLANALGNDRKGKASLVLYAVAVVCAFVQPWISLGLYVSVAALWFIPDRRIEKAIRGRGK
jgi:uncharacterized membrane protein